MRAEVENRFGFDLVKAGEPDGPTLSRAWESVRTLLDEQGSRTWAAAEGDMSLVGYTEAVMVAENATLTQLVIEHRKAGVKGYKPPRNRLEESRRKRAAMDAARGGVESMAAFFGIPLDQLEGYED